MTLIKAKDLDIFTWKENRTLSFTYRPADGLVRAANKPSTERAIAYFSYKQYRIDWKKSNTSQGILQVRVPEHLSPDEEAALLESSLDDMDATSIKAAEKAKEELLLQNVDNKTGKHLNFNTLKDFMARMEKNPKLTTPQIAEWFNRLNLEVERPDHPLIKTSTKPKKTIISEGRKLVFSLYDKGSLRRLTEEEYSAKVEKYTEKVEDTKSE